MNKKDSVLRFDKEGRIILPGSVNNGQEEENGDEEGYVGEGLKTSQDLEFLKDEKVEGVDRIKNESIWSLYENGKFLDEMVYSNGKKQSDIVREVVELIKGGRKIIFLHGTCGTGKCLEANTRIFCKLDNTSYFAYHSISNLIGKKGKILSLNNKGNIIETDFGNVIYSGKKMIYKLRTRTGREIKASENHPFLTITRKGLEWISLRELKEDSYICLPNHFTLRRYENLDKNIIKILAHLIAEGKLGDKAGSPKYYQNKEQDPEVREDYETALKELFPEGKIRSSSDCEVTIIFNNKDTRYGTTNKLRLLVRKFGLDGKRSKDKFVPSVIFNLNDKDTALFLKTLFSGDGSIYKRVNKKRENNQVVIEYSSISRKLIQDISILLMRFGIQHTITSRKFRSNKEYSWRISISNHRQIKKFIEQIGFLGKRDQLAKEIYPELKEHKFTNIDKVPRIIRDNLKDKGYNYSELNRFLNYEDFEKIMGKINLKKAIREKVIECPYVFKQQKIDFLREHIKKINKYLDDEDLSFICSEDIVWDKIKSKKFIGEDETYDLEVPEYKNFIADGIIVHNSAVALNIARELGRASIVVPVKALQRQYEEDYMGKKYVLKKNGRKMKIAMITGRENHDSIIKPGVSCSDAFLPDTIAFSEKNSELIKDYYDSNPFIKNKLENIDVREMKRISIAPANPYWSPIVPAEHELRQLSDAKKKKYKGLMGKEFIFYHRKTGCSYFDQYQAYLDADVLIFNSAKYKIECALDRKPLTDVEIIDEGDEFLDSFSTQRELNLTRLGNALKTIVPDFAETEDIIESILELIKLEEKHARAVGVSDNKIYPLNETKVEKILKIFLSSSNLQTELAIDELNYGNHAFEVAEDFEGFFEESYLSYRYKDDNLIASIVTTNLSKKFKEIADKNKAIVLMSGTIHSSRVLKDVFGISDYVVVEAETKLPGVIEIVRTGKEFDCRYANFLSGDRTRDEYLLALENCLEKAKKPVLVQVNAFEDLPLEEEVNRLGIAGVMFRERMRELQKGDKTGRMVSMFKQKMIDVLFSTKCSRGVDFPGDICNSVVFTKYPNPNVKNIFWKVLEKTHRQIYWEFYKDKAYRELLQRLYRAVRSQNDYVYVLSPDLRVLDAVRGLQVRNNKG